VTFALLSQLPESGSSSNSGRAHAEFTQFMGEHGTRKSNTSAHAPVHGGEPATAQLIS
jgi:hypothetical protein